MAYIIGLDAGHYVGDGRVSKAYRSKLGTNDEYTLNLRTWKKVKEALEYNGFKVVDIGRQYKSVTDRAKLAKSLGCDIVISLHHNAGGGRGISMFIHLNGAMGSKSAQLQKMLYEHLEKVNKGNRSNPLKKAILGVINCNTTGCPSVLIECGFMDNDTDVARINSTTYNDELAQAILKGVCKYFGVAVKTASSNATPIANVEKKYNPYAYAKVQKIASNDVLNVRSGPSVNYGIVRTLSNGNEVDVIETYTNGWAKINIVNVVGYVNSYYLNITEPVKIKTATVVNCTALNIRSTPNGPKIVGTVSKGTVIEIIGEGKDSDGDVWTKVRKGTLEGYVWPKYLKM